MAVRDTWHRALVYFGLAEDPEYRYSDDELYDEPDTVDEQAVEPPPPRRRRGGGAGSNVRRLRREDPSEIDDIFADEPAPSRRRLRPVSNGDNVQVHFVTPRNFNDAQEVADKFKRAVPVILNLQSASADLSKRLIDFSSGLTYALDGGMQKIADKTFLLTPANVEVSAEEKARLVEKGFFNQS
jgi:cell division inhibitor SepF